MHTQSGAISTVRERSPRELLSTRQRHRAINSGQRNQMHHADNGNYMWRVALDRFADEKPNAYIDVADITDRTWAVDARPLGLNLGITFMNQCHACGLECPRESTARSTWHRSWRRTHCSMVSLVRTGSTTFLDSPRRTVRRSRFVNGRESPDGTSGDLRDIFSSRVH